MSTESVNPAFTSSSLWTPTKMGTVPYWVTGYFLRFLAWKFSALENLIDPALRVPEFLWKPDDTVNESMTKGILLTTHTAWVPRDAQQRPAVVIKRNRFNVEPQVSLGDRYHTPTLKIGEHDPNLTANLGQRQQLLEISGSHTFFCIASSGAGAEALGGEIWSALSDYQLILREELGFHRLRTGGMEAASRLEEAAESWVVPVVVSYIYQRSTVINQLSPLLKRVVFSTATDAGS